MVGWLVVLRINVDLAIFQPYLDLEAGDNQSLKIQVARPGIEPRSSCPASQELNHSATAAPINIWAATNLYLQLNKRPSVTILKDIMQKRFWHAIPYLRLKLKAYKGVFSYAKYMYSFFFLRFYHSLRFFYIKINTVDGLIFMGYQFSWILWRVRSTNSSTNEMVIFCMNYEGKYYVHEFWTPGISEFCQIHENWYPRK